MRRVASRDNPRIKALTRLARSNRAQREECVALLDGPHLIQMFRRTRPDASARVLVVSEAALAQVEVRELFESPNALPATERLVVTERVFAAISPVEHPVGVLACIDLPRESNPPQWIDDAVVLDSVQDPGNAGALLRTAAAAGLRTILATPGTTWLWSPKVLRAAMGAHFELDLLEDVDLATLRPRMRGTVLAAALDAQDDLYALDLRTPCIWLFGNEGAGLGAAARELATRTVRIPMPGAIESLNVAAAAAVCLFEQVRQRRAA